MGGGGGMTNFQKQLSELINRCSLENQSNTPDWILAQLLTSKHNKKGNMKWKQ